MIKFADLEEWFPCEWKPAGRRFLTRVEKRLFTRINALVFRLLFVVFVAVSLVSAGIGLLVVAGVVLLLMPVPVLLLIGYRFSKRNDYWYSNGRTSPSLENMR